MILILIATACLLTPEASTKLISTPSGVLSGSRYTSRNGRSYDAYTKIPYAQPPVGELRFQNPKEFGKWEGVYRAVEAPPKCVQSESGQVPAVVSGSEDCLFLNVYRPEVNNNSLPVLFYVHGGSFSSGHPGLKDSASYIMDEDVILVTVAYRVGVLGFMSLRDDVLPGNFGLKDQAMALKWVYKNIASFGGNPKSITVFGESAGGASAHLLAISPLTRDLVSSAAMISGTAYLAKRALLVPGHAEAETLRMTKLLGCPIHSSEEVVKCLRNVDSYKLTGTTNIDGLMPFAPVIEPAGEGSFLPISPFELKTSQPWMLSFSEGERLLNNYKYYYYPSLLKNVMENLDEFIQSELLPYFGTNVSEWAKVKARYFTSVENRDDKVQIGLILEDPGFVYPVLEIGQIHEGPKWMYHFEYRGEFTTIPIPGMKIVSHVDDGIYLFNRTELYGSSLNQEDTQVSKTMVKLLANFATYGNPSPPGATDVPVWHEFRTNEILRITNTSFSMAEPSFYRGMEDIYGFWKSVNTLDNMP